MAPQVIVEHLELVVVQVQLVHQERRVQVVVLVLQVHQEVQVLQVLVVL